MTHLTPGAWLGIALFAGYALWLFAFFTFFRPRLMRALGRRLDTEVVESTNVEDAGTWSADADAPPRKVGAVAGVDVVVLLVATVGVAALVFVPAFIVAESGALLPLESRMTGRAVVLELPSPPSMPAEQGRAALAIEIENTGRVPLKGCRATVDGYGARNGYLRGASPVFDIGIGARVAAIVALDATRPPLGTHEVHIKVECDNERLAVGATTLTVR